MSVKFGVIVPQGWRLDLLDEPDPVAKYETMTRVARQAEDLGYDSIWLYDHFHTTPVKRVETTFEAWIATAALARDTQRVRIGQMVTCNNYRPPALLAKMASTVDVLSHGRLDFGIGAGWYEEEFRAYGYDFPDGPERLRMLEESLQVILAMWQEEYATFAGRYYQIKDAVNEPKGVQQPHPPIWIGGSGEKVTLKLVAKYGDACNIVGVDPALVRHKLEVLREHCERLGRDYDHIVKSHHTFIHLLAPGESPEAAVTEVRRRTGAADVALDNLRKGNIIAEAGEVAERLQALVEAGMEYMVIYFRNGLADGRSLERFAAEVMPQFR
jgi:F420-dependent oxidoreductase-like protein